MKTISNLVAKILLGSLLSTSATFSGATTITGEPKAKSDTSSHLDIEGTIFVENKEINGNYVLEVIYFDSVISTHKIKNNKPVVFHLKKNDAYTFRISKKGYIAREICLSTAIKNKQSQTSSYGFYIETDFIEIAEAMKMDDEALKLPIAMIKYDERKGNFISNRDYSIFVRQKLHVYQSDLGLLSLKD
jgi:hypothetical protein